MIGNKKGLTLIEVIFVIVRMAIALPVLVFSLSEQSKAGVNFEVSVVMSGLAQQKIEELIADKRANGYGAVAIDPAPPTENPLPGYDRTAEVCYADPITLVETIPCDNDTLDTNYKIITVTVQKPGLATSGTVIVQTIIAYQ